MAIIIPFPNLRKPAGQAGAVRRAALPKGMRSKTFRCGDDPLSAKYVYLAPQPVSEDSFGRGIYNIPEADALRDYFEFFGLAVEPRAYSVLGLMNAFAWFQGDVKGRATALLADPEAYPYLYPDTTVDEQAYIRALLAKDSAAATEALPKTDFIWRLLEQLGSPAVNKRV